jgi:hypothetical protein
VVDRAAVWLLRKPSPALVDPVWRLVCLAALDAMDFGRRLLWARRHATDWPDPGPVGLAALRLAILPDLVDSHVWPAVTAARAVTVDAVSNQAVARFWLTLSDFADTHVEPPAGFVTTPAGHPFLAVVGGRLRARLPPGLPVE